MEIKNQEKKQETQLSKKRQKAKDKRNKEYEDMSKECSKLNISEIKVEDFVDARKRELNKFVKILNSKYSNKSGFQLLPKHMRRRCMSHNPYRIPLRARVFNLKVNTKSKCTKHKRKKNNYRKSITKRAILNNWLETHLWHSKRFFMKKLFGYTIPYRRMDKSYKACYRFSKYDACINDSSYFQYYFLECDNGVEEFTFIIKKISIGFNTNNLSSFSNYKIDVYDNNRLIGPARFILMNNFILIMFHPMMKLELSSILERLNISYKFIGNGLNNFSIIGDRSGSKIYKIFQSLNFDSNEYYKNEEEFEKFIHYMGNNDLLLFKIDWPNLNFKMNEMVFNKLLKKNLSSDVKMLNTCSISEMNYYNLNNIELKTYFQETENEKQYIELPTERTIFTHRKKVDINNLNEKILRSKDEIKSNIVKEFENNIDLQFKKSNYTNEKKTFIILFKTNIRKNNTLTISPIYNILFVKGIANNLLKRFSYIETKVIGLKEINNFLTDSNYLNFPYDYPSTKSYLEFTKDRAKNIIEKYCKYPPSKRINYQKIGNPYPFYPLWNEKNKFEEFNKNVYVIPNILNSSDLYLHMQNIFDKNEYKFILPCYFKMFSKGIPSFNSQIYMPNDEDFNLFEKKFQSEIDLLINSDIEQNYKEIIQNMKISKDKNKFIQEPVCDYFIKNKKFNSEYNILKNSTEEIIYASEILNKDFTIKTNGGKSREIIGFVSSGKYSYNTSRGEAKGFIYVHSYEKILKIKKIKKCDKNIVLIRHRNSRIYFFAYIELI